MTDQDAVLNLMNEAEAVYLATIDGSTPRVRAMVNLRRSDHYPEASTVCREAGFTVYFTTSIASGKVKELRANPMASAYYCEPRKYHGAMLTGPVEIVEDRELGRALWSDGWRMYWPQGPDDPDYVVLRMNPTHANGWWGSTPFYFEVGGK